MDHKLYPECKRWCVTPKYSCLSIFKCAKIQRDRSPILKSMFGDDFGEFYDSPAWKARS